jgi:hypothetical protein
MRPKVSYPITGRDGFSENKKNQRLAQIAQVEAIEKSGFEGDFGNGQDTTTATSCGDRHRYPGVPDRNAGFLQGVFSNGI